MSDEPLDDDDDLAEVIVLPTKINSADPEHLKLIVNNKGACSHRGSYTIDESVRRVMCDHCHTELSHWEVLMAVANDCQRRASWRDHVKREHAALESRVEVMKALHSRLLQKLRNQIERLTGQKADGWALRNGIDHELREAARSAKLGGIEDASACGLKIGKGGADARVRVTLANGTRAEYRIDRWD